MLKANSLTKKFGKKYALNNFVFELKEGEIIGLLGPNNSGKSTFMRIASGVMAQTSGEILINGFKPSSESKKIISYLPDTNPFPEWFSIKDAVTFYINNFKDFSIDNYNKFSTFMKIPVQGTLTSLSKGVLQKLRLSLALARQCRYYLLDEPLDGIDPLSREVICEAIIQVIDDTSNIIITTHLINEIERLLDRAVFINNGESIFEISCEELRQKRNMSINDMYKEVFTNV